MLQSASFVVNIMSADALASFWARASADMILTIFAKKSSLQEVLWDMLAYLWNEIWIYNIYNKNIYKKEVRWDIAGLQK